MTPAETARPSRLPLFGTVRLVARACARLFFRSVAIEGLSNVPSDGGALFVANHPNNLMDPVLLLAYVPRKVRFVAAAFIWRIPVLSWFLRASGAIPVFRPGREEKRTRDANLRSFEAGESVLRAGGAMGIFPEGFTHDEPQLAMLKTGPARMALRAAVGGEAVRIVPIGLHYRRKLFFRSEASLRIGRPIELSRFRPPPGRDADWKPAVIAVTRAIEDGLERITVNLPDLDARWLVHRASELYAAEYASRRHRLSVAAGWRLEAHLIALFGQRYALRARTDPTGVAKAEAAMRRYDYYRRGFEVRDHDLAAGLSQGTSIAHAAGALLGTVAAFPFAAAGVIANYLPYKLPGFVASFQAHPLDPPSYKLVMGVVLFTVWWAALGGVLAWRAGAAVGLAAATAGPLLGLFALWHLERRASAWDRLRSAWTARAKKGWPLLAMRDALLRELDSVVDEEPGGRAHVEAAVLAAANEREMPPLPPPSTRRRRRRR